jgi:hypothetical protein
MDNIVLDLQKLFENHYQLTYDEIVRHHKLTLDNGLSHCTKLW